MISKETWLNERYGYVTEFYDVDEGVTRKLIRYVIHDGMHLFAVYATYARVLRCRYPYYVVARDLKEAKKIWRKSEGILTLVERIESVSDDEVDAILNNPYIMIR
ncbi:MAG: hypothetical protein J6Y20_11555 [Lachnospiraceae bacterium]|nr:hypothetical protein [Lachnospiraceae bacterium]